MKPEASANAQKDPSGEVADPRLLAVLVTYRRPRELATMLARVAEQSRKPDLLLVVDNSPSEEHQEILRRSYPEDPVRYVPAPSNLGWVGGVAAGMELILEQARDQDWILLLDDDNPPPSPTVLEEVFRFGQDMLRADDRTAAVGLAGITFDWKRGWMRREHHDAIDGPVPVDQIGGSRLPMYRVGPARDVGSYGKDLFFGWGELEYGLRLRRAGYTLYAHGPLWVHLYETFREIRSKTDYAAPSRSGWRSYYSARNLIYICRLHRHRGAAARVTLRRGIVRPLSELIRSRMSPRDVALTFRGCRDGWLGRLGRTVDPARMGTRR